MNYLAHLRQGIEGLEHHIDQQTEGSRRWAELHLAWRRMMDGYHLIATGNMTPDDLLWASEEAKKIVEQPEEG